MATECEGNTINVGDRVVLVPKIASLSGQKVVLGNRDPIKVDGEDVLIPRVALVHEGLWLIILLSTKKRIKDLSCLGSVLLTVFKGLQ